MTPEERKLIQFKTFEFELEEVKANDEKEEAIIEGYASTFGNMDQGFDVVEKGAFKATLKANKGVVPILADHSPYDQVGWGVKGEEDDRGLFVVGSLALAVQKARERYALAKKAKELKARAGISIGYSTIKAEPDDKNPRIRRLKELKLWEYSLVTFPMNTEAFVTAAKSIGEFGKLQDLIKILKEQNVNLKDLEIALRQEAARVDEDPTKISQSIDALIQKFRQG